MKIIGIDGLDDLIKGINSAFDHIQAIDHKQTQGGEFVPDGIIYSTDEQAKFAAENPDVERAIQHELYEVDRRIKNA